MTIKEIPHTPSHSSRGDWYSCIQISSSLNHLIDRPFRDAVCVCVVTQVCIRNSPLGNICITQELVERLLMPNANLSTFSLTSLRRSQSSLPPHLQSALNLSLPLLFPLSTALFVFLPAPHPASDSSGALRPRRSSLFGSPLRLLADLDF